MESTPSSSTDGAAVSTVQQQASPDAAALRRLIEAAQTGAVEAFEVLYRQHLGRVYALCLRMAGNVQEAEELTQDAFVRAWENLPSFRHQSAFGSWLHRLTVNVVLQRWRSRGRRRERVVSMAETTAQVDDPVHHPQPRLGLDLERAIRGLPTGARTVFVLYDIEGYRHRDIAEMTGLKIGTCKAQLHRARKLLRETLR